MFYLWFSAAATLVEASGLAAAMGVSTSNSAGKRIQQSVDALGSVTGGGGAVESLLGVFRAVANGVAAFTSALTAGPRMFAALGVPEIIVVFMHAPLALLAARIGIYALSGREL